MDTCDSMNKSRRRLTTASIQETVHAYSSDRRLHAVFNLCMLQLGEAKMENDDNLVFLLSSKYLRGERRFHQLLARIRSIDFESTSQQRRDRRKIAVSGDISAIAAAGVDALTAARALRTAEETEDRTTVSRRYFTLRFIFWNKHICSSVTSRAAGRREKPLVIQRYLVFVHVEMLFACVWCCRN